MITENTPTSAADLAGSIVDAMPEAMKAPPDFKLEPDAPASSSVPVDSIGRKFDPAKFVSKDGRPSLTGTGRFIPRSPGRYGAKAKPVSQPIDASPGAEPPRQATPLKSEIPPDAAPPVSASPWDKFDHLAEVYSRAFYSTADGLFAGRGEWVPESEGEHEGFRKSLAAYLRSKNMEDLSPGWAFAFAIGSYSARRLQQPNTATRLRLYWNWFRARFMTWRTGRKIEAVSIAPPEPQA